MTFYAPEVPTKSVWWHSFASVPGSWHGVAGFGHGEGLVGPTLQPAHDSCALNKTAHDGPKGLGGITQVSAVVLSERRGIALRKLGRMLVCVDTQSEKLKNPQRVHI